MFQKHLKEQARKRKEYHSPKVLPVKNHQKNLKKSKKENSANPEHSLRIL